jgi:hypothetical protein
MARKENGQCWWPQYLHLNLHRPINIRILLSTLFSFKILYFSNNIIILENLVFFMLKRVEGITMMSTMISICSRGHHRMISSPSCSCLLGWWVSHGLRVESRGGHQWVVPLFA